MEEATLEQLTAMQDIGDIVAQSVTEFFSFTENRLMVERLLAAGVAPQEAEAAKEGAFSGKSIVVTGTLPTLSRKEAEDLIRANGGTAAASVSKKTAFVVAGEAPGSKLTKAQSLGIEIIDEAELIRRIGLDFVHRTWIEIDLDKVKENYRTACSLTGASVTCVVKSNAYGHGAVRIAQALQEAGCASFAVSCAREAFELRQNGITGELLIMGLTDRPDAERCIREHIVMTVGSLSELTYLQSRATSLQEPASVQLKLDTGFHRLGFSCDPHTARDIAGVVRGLSMVRVEGMFSHLGLVNHELDKKQHTALLDMQGWLKEAGLAIEHIHICDSIGLVRYPEWHHSRVRVGAFLFGVRPSRSQDMPFRCEETLVFKTTVSRIHAVPKGGIVGYGDDMPMERDSRVATLCAGYGDGYPRCLSNARGQVLIRGHLCPVVGLVCMDQMMVDVTDVPEAAEGDEVTLLGGGISYSTYSDWCRTNRNECITILSRRPLRVYREQGRVVTVIDSMLNERRDCL